MGKTAAIFENGILQGLGLIEKDIKNATYLVWEKETGGDYYWDHVFHALGSIPMLLSLLGAENTAKIPDGIVGSLQEPKNNAVPHGRDLALSYLKQVRNFVKKFFAEYDERNIFDAVTFYGQPNTHGGVLCITAAHLQYHAGVCDTALRENGLKGSM